MLELKNICFERDNKKILDNISLTIDTDKFVVITGPNGSGKSTILRMIAGLLPSGKNAKIHLDNKDITKLPDDSTIVCGVEKALEAIGIIWGQYYEGFKIFIWIKFIL